SALKKPKREALRTASPRSLNTTPQSGAIRNCLNFVEQEANNSAHSPSKIYAGKEAKGNRMKTWLAPLLFATSLLGQPPKLRLPDESPGIDGIARTLISVFDQADIVALGEAHQQKLDSDLRIALVRHPDFAKKVRSIVVEFAS